MLAAGAFVVLLVGLAGFQVALACGAPIGRYAYGGQHERVLPRRLRVTSIVAVLIYAVIGLLVLDGAGAVDVVPDAVSRVGTWVLVVVLVAGTLLNAISRSRHERYAMTPLALLLAVLALVVALSPRS